MAGDDAATVAEDSGATSIDVLANDTDVDGHALSVASVTDPANGTTVDNDANVSYTPDANFCGTDTFDYIVSDGNGGTDTATVTVTVTCLNDPPNAVADTATVAEDSGATSIDVLDNDTDGDDDSLVVTLVTNPANGTAVDNDSDVSYTPDADFCGTDTFDYTVSDGNGGHGHRDRHRHCHVRERRAGRERRRLLGDGGRAARRRRTRRTGERHRRRRRDAVGGARRRRRRRHARAGCRRLVHLRPGRELLRARLVHLSRRRRRRRVERRHGVDHSRLRQRHARTRSTTPLRSPRTRPRRRSTSSANDTDADSTDTLLVASVTDPANGTAVDNDTNVSYTPNANFCGEDTFDYTISDGNGGTDTATVTVTVTCVNDDPVAANDAATVAEDSSATSIDVLGERHGRRHDRHTRRWTPSPIRRTERRSTTTRT